MKTYVCATCDRPWMDRDDNPLVYDTLDAIPIGWCDCDDQHIVEQAYSKTELREAYYLATEPTSRVGKAISIALPEVLLTDLGWIVVEDDGPYLTSHGRKLFPLLLVVANELQA